jgi:nitrogen regulatory protein P-II 1
LTLKAKTVLKKIEAIIRREKFPAVDEALKRMGVGGLTVEEVAGRGRARHTTTVLAKGRWDYEEEYIKHLKLEILVQESNAQGVIDAIMASASTGSVGDGKIFVSSVDEVLDIGSKAVDEKAVTFATIPKQN